MPRKLRDLSGDDLIRIFQKYGFDLSFSKGSHCKLTRIIAGEQQILLIPRHRSLAKGTLKAIYQKAIQYILESELRMHFYTE